MTGVSLFANRWLQIIWALLLTVLCLLVVNPYQFGVNDHWYMLPWLKNWLHPELFTVDTIIPQRQYHYSMLYPILRNSPFTLELSFFVLYCLSLFLVFYLSMSIHKLFSSKLVFLTPVFLLLPWYLPGGTFTIASHLLIRTSALPWLFLSVYFILRDQRMLAWIMAGLAFWFHPLSALYLATFYFFLELLYFHGNRKAWARMLVFSLFCLPVFYLKFTAESTGFPGFWADEYWLETMRLRSGHHSFPHIWPKSHFFSAALLLIAGAGAAWLSGNVKLAKLAIVIMVGTLALYLLGLVFTYFTPAYSAIEVQPFRSIRLMALLFLALLPAAASIDLSGTKKWFIPIVLAALCLAAYQQSKLHFFFYFSLSCIILIYQFLPFLRAWVSLLSLAPVIILLLNKPYYGLDIQAPERNKELYKWIENHSDTSSLWVIPSDLMYFRTDANRSAFITWQDGTFGYFDHNYNRLWRQRYTALYGGFGADFQEPQVSTAVELHGLISDLPASQVFLLKREPLDTGGFHLKWQNEEFYLYQVKTNFKP